MSSHDHGVVRGCTEGGCNCVSRSSAIASSLPVSWSEMAVRTSTSHAARRTCSALSILCLKTKSDGLRPARTDGSSEGRMWMVLSTPCASTAGCVLPRPSCLIITTPEPTAFLTCWCPSATRRRCAACCVCVSAHTSWPSPIALSQRAVNVIASAGAFCPAVCPPRFAAILTQSSAPTALSTE